MNPSTPSESKSARPASGLWVFLTFFGVLTSYTGLKIAMLFPVHIAWAWAFSAILCLTILSWQMAYRADLFPEEAFGSRALAWTVTFLMGIWITFLCLSLAVDIGQLVFLAFLKMSHAPSLPRWMEPLFMRWLPVAIVAISGGIAVVGIHQVLSGPVIRDVAVPITDLPEELAGLRIVQLSDFHIGPTIRQGYIERVVDNVLSLRPDLIAITGDLADGSVERLNPLVNRLARLKAPMGVYYVSGNHEYYWDAEAWLKKGSELGFIPLVNENRIVLFHGVPILIGGVTDTTAGHFIPAQTSDPHRASVTDQHPRFRLLLAHRPDSCLEAEPAGFDLQLSGHTHGGQFFPFSLLIPLFHQYYRGLNRHGRMWVYVNTGTGYWGPPDRFAVPSEITLLTLVRR